MTDDRAIDWVDWPVRPAHRWTRKKWSWRQPTSHLTPTY